MRDLISVFCGGSDEVQAASDLGWSKVLSTYGPDIDTSWRLKVAVYRDGGRTITVFARNHVVPLEELDLDEVYRWLLDCTWHIRGVLRHLPMTPFELGFELPWRLLSALYSCDVPSGMTLTQYLGPLAARTLQRFKAKAKACFAAQGFMDAHARDASDPTTILALRYYRLASIRHRRR